MSTQTESEEVRIVRIWAYTIIVVSFFFLLAITATCKINKDLESNMAENGYEQSSLPGQTGVYWTKKDGSEK